MDREVAAAEVLGADVGDERLVGGAVEALADPEEPVGDREPDERRRRLEPGPVASTSSQATAQRSGISASARIRRLPSMKRESGSCASTITPVLTAKTRPIWRSLIPLVVAGELREEVDERVPGRDEQEVQHPEPEEGPVAEHGARRRPAPPVSFGAAPGSWMKNSTTDVTEERHRVEQEQEA